MMKPSLLQNAVSCVFSSNLEKHQARVLSFNIAKFGANTFNVVMRCCVSHCGFGHLSHCKEEKEDLPLRPSQLCCLWVGLYALGVRHPLMHSLGVEVGVAPLFHNLCSLPRTRVFPASTVAAVNSPCTRGRWIYLMQLTAGLSTRRMSVGVKPKYK